MEEAETLNLRCHMCGSIGFSDGGDGFFYCINCNSQAEDIIETGVADEDFVVKGGDARGAIYLASNRRQRPSSQTLTRHELFSQSQSLFQTLTQEQTPFKTPKKEEPGLEDPYYSGNYIQSNANHGSQYGDDIDGMGPIGPEDFGASGTRKLSYEDYYEEVRIRYVMGLQLMVEYQCMALVNDFNVHPLVIEVAKRVWLQYLKSTRVFSESWADEAIHDSECLKEGVVEGGKPRPEHKAEPHNIHGKRAVMIWYRSLRNTLPLSCSLVVCFLACHIIREPILPTDLVKWTLEGRLPYFAAFVDIQKEIAPPSSACPLSFSFMFRPAAVISAQKFEPMAASIAQSIGMALPPVNFYGIASRYLTQLSLPVEKILPVACRIQEWAMPPGLWLSTNESRFPTRVCVMSILIVAIRILYNIHGFGEWEKSLSCKDKITRVPTDEVMLKLAFCSKVKEFEKGGSLEISRDGDQADGTCVGDTSYNQKPFNAQILLQNLHERYSGIDVPHDYSKDLQSYLQFCKDVVFAGLEPSFEDYEEEKVGELLWDFYQKNMDIQEDIRESLHCSPCDSSTDDDQQTAGGSWSSEYLQPTADSELRDDTADRTHRLRAIQQLKLDMEENRFCYIPPRKKPKRLDYLHYVRKRDDGVLVYVAHADYYILLRSCARLAQIDVRLMHAAVLKFERRLALMENIIDHVLHVIAPEFSSNFDGSGDKEPAPDDPIDLSHSN